MDKEKMKQISNQRLVYWMGRWKIRFKGRLYKNIIIRFIVLILEINQEVTHELRLIK